MAKTFTKFSSMSYMLYHYIRVGRILAEESAGSRSQIECTYQLREKSDGGVDRYEEKGGENSYEYKMKKVLKDMKSTEQKRTNEDWDVTKYGESIERVKGNHTRNGKR